MGGWDMTLLTDEADKNFNAVLLLVKLIVEGWNKLKQNHDYALLYTIMILFTPTKIPPV